MYHRFSYFFISKKQTLAPGGFEPLQKVFRL